MTFRSDIIYDKGSHKNKFAILSVEAPVWQGAKAQEYQDISSFRNATRRDASAIFRFIDLCTKHKYIISYRYKKVKGKNLVVPILKLFLGTWTN